MNLNKIKHEDSSKDWQIWNKRSGVERSIKRLKKQLPEMECSKQLTQIIKRYYKPGYKILDFCCASGHYFNSLKKIDKNINYTGFDATKVYIKFAKNFFKKEKNSKFEVQNLFSMSKKYRNKFDISYCSNVFHHIPSIDIPLKNLISSAKKYCIIRTLVSENTHLSKLYYNDNTNKKGVLDNFVFQNTYSYSLIRKKIKKLGNFKVTFENDLFKGSKINKEFKKDKKKYPGLTRFIQGHQISGSKVFEFKWIVIKK